MAKVGMIGAGSWGTALALVLADNGHEVTLWSHEAEHIAAMQADGENKLFLPGVPLPDCLAYTSDLEQAVTGCDFVVFAVPSHAMQPVAGSLRGLIDEQAILVSVAKGFSLDSHQRMSEVLAAAFPANRVAVLSGPSHAEEVSRRIPTAIVAASVCEEAMLAVQELFSNDYMRVYTNSDVLGVELGGSLKNVIALASGICYGLGCGDNTEAAILTRGLKEIVRLGRAMGAQEQTFYGLSGMGDLVVTCGSMHSRNRRAGMMLGEGKKLDEVLDSMGMVVEGVNASRIAYTLAQDYNVDMPITETIYSILYGDVSVAELAVGLMRRDKKQE